MQILPRLHDTLCEVSISAQRAAKQLLEARDALGLGNHPVLLESFTHHSHVERHPTGNGRHHLTLKRVQIVPAVANGASGHLGPDRGDVVAGHMLRPYQLDHFLRKRIRASLPSEKLKNGDVSDVSYVHHGEADVTDRHRVDAMTDNDVLETCVILHEKGGAKDCSRQLRVLYAALSSELSGEMGNAGVGFGSEDREIDDSLQLG